MNRRRTRRAHVVGDGNGFSVDVRGETPVRVEWRDVVEITAFKIDLFSYDEIVLGFRLADDDAVVEVSEESDGYSELVAELESRFPGIRTDWFSEVALPAFAENRTTLWERSSVN